MVLTDKELQARKAVHNVVTIKEMQGQESVKTSFLKGKKSRVKEVQDPRSSETWIFMHPDTTASDPVRSGFTVSLACGRSVRIFPDNGRYTTNDAEIRDQLLLNGFVQTSCNLVVQNEDRWAEHLRRHKEKMK